MGGGGKVGGGGNRVGGPGSLGAGGRPGGGGSRVGGGGSVAGRDWVVVSVGGGGRMLDCATLLVLVVIALDDTVEFLAILA